MDKPKPQCPSEAFEPEYHEQVKETVGVIFTALRANEDDNAVQAQVAIVALIVVLQEAIASNCFPVPHWAGWAADRIANLRDLTD